MGSILIGISIRPDRSDWINNPQDQPQTGSISQTHTGSMTTRLFLRINPDGDTRLEPD